MNVGKLEKIFQEIIEATHETSHLRCSNAFFRYKQNLIKLMNS